MAKVTTYAERYLKKLLGLLIALAVCGLLLYGAWALLVGVDASSGAILLEATR